MDCCVFDELEQLKKRISDNVSVNDTIVCGLCDALIHTAGQHNDRQSVAFGYVWRADYFFYVASDLNAFAKELDLAQIYIDEQTPSILLEKYYTLRHVLCENSYDVQSAFHYVLKALDVSEKLGLGHRIGANYGNIGAYYMDICCYGEALLYTEKALETLRIQPNTRPRITRLLLTNLIQVNLRLGQHDKAKTALQELSELPIEQKDLTLYLDYGFLLYYAEVLDLENSLRYLKAMFEDGVLELPRAFSFELLSQALEAMMRLEQWEQAEALLSQLQTMIQDHEPDAQLSLCQLSLEYAQRMALQERLRHCYRQYYTCYMAAQAKSNRLKAEGLHLMVELNELHSKNIQSQKELKELSLLANFDSLTMVYNRRYFNIRQDELLNCGLTSNLGYAMIDIDYFKEYNDHYGHLTGDGLLRRVGACLQESATAQMEVFRYGGDEFVCLSWDAEPGALKAYVQRIQSTLGTTRIDHIQSRCADRVTLSIGYGTRPVKGKADLLALFEEVDNALYAAKHSGRNAARSIEEMLPAKEEISCVALHRS